MVHLNVARRLIRSAMTDPSAASALLWQATESIDRALAAITLATPEGEAERVVREAEGLFDLMGCFDAEEAL